MERSFPWIAIVLCAVFAGLLFVSTNSGNWKSGGKDVASGHQPKLQSITKLERQIPAPRTKKETREKFVAERNRGIGESEIRRILDDALAAGIVDVGKPYPTLDDFKELMLRRNRWYLEILNDGLGLSRAQKGSLRAVLIESEGNYSGFLDGYIKMETSDEAAKKPLEHRDHIDEMEKIVRALSLVMMGEIFSEEFPSVIPEAQFEILTQQGNSGTGYLKGSKQTRDFGTDERYEWSESSMLKPGNYMNAGRVFPLSMTQVDRMRALQEGDLLGRSKVLTGGQFKTLLLHSPALVPAILRELDKPR